MLKRVISTLGLWTFLYLLLYFFGATGAIWTIAIFAVLTLREFFGLLKHMGYAPFTKLAMIIGAAIVLAPYYLTRYHLNAAELVAFGVIAFSVRILAEREPENRVESLAASIFGLVYVPTMLQYLVRIVMIDTPNPHSGIALALWLIAVSKFCDVGALLTGMAIGKTKMAPVISPKKTWEGAIGGLIVSGLVGGAIAYWARPYMPAHFTPLIAAAVAVPIAIIAIVADLVESIIKRRATIKDSGATIPGIGGIFDLTDSLILTAPIGYFLFQLL